MATDVENKSGTIMIYSADNIMKRKRLGNPKVEDENGQKATSLDEIFRVTTSFFKEKFLYPHLHNIDQFRCPARQVCNEITKEEVHKSLSKLNNNRAAESDDITGELLTYGAKQLSPQIANILNNVFKIHIPLKINKGKMITLPKQEKLKGLPRI